MPVSRTPSSTKHWPDIGYHTGMEPEAIFVLSSLLFVFSLALTLWIHSRQHIDTALPGPQELGNEGDLPELCVVVPARNEGRNIRRSVQALLAQDYPDYRLVVVDDRSRDETEQILAELSARDSRLKVVAGREPPAGWAGKPHALTLGVEACPGEPPAEWLCFIDADTFAAPHLLRSAVGLAGRCQADMLSILTDQELGSFWEKAILPLVFTALSVGFPADQVNDPHRPVAIANGQFILIRRAVYEAVGGHRAVRSEIAEDKALAERVKHSGYRLLLADGRHAARTRMYTSFAEIWEGWTKNIYLGMRDRVGLLLFGAFTCLTGALAFPLWPLAGILWLLSGGGLPAAFVCLQALVLWAVLLYLRIRTARAMHIHPLYALTFSPGLLVFAAMMMASIYNVLSGRGVKWKGRVYR